MKTFREFITEAERRAPRNPGESLQDYIKRVKGISNHPDAKIADTPGAADPRTPQGKSTNVSGQDVRSGSQTRTQQAPPKQPTGTSQTPPRSAQTGTQTPPKQPKASTPPPPKAEPKAPQTPPKAEPKASTPPPPKAPTSNDPVPSAKPAASVPKGTGLRARLGKYVGPAVSAGLDYQTRRSEGQSRIRSAGGAAASAAGYARGAKMGASLASKLPIPNPLVKAAVVGAGGLAGGLAGDTATSAAYDYAVDKTRPARQAVAKATGYDKFQQKNALIKPGSGLSGVARAQQTVDTRGARQVAAKAGTYGAKQGSALSGIGGQTTTSKDKKGNAFMSTGAGSQRKTVQLAKTQLVRDPKSGKQVVGDLAFKGGKATYLARPSVASRDTSLAARLGRALNVGKYSKAAETQAAKQEYRTALKNTQTYQKKLGVTPKAATAQKLPGRGVGPAKVGPKKVGPKLVGPKKVGTGAKPSATVKPA